MFISFEGMEGSGKSTAVSRIGAWLERTRREVVYTREPGGSELGEALRAILLDARGSGIVPRAELFLYLADRAQHTARVVRPALARGAFVLCDRYADSTIAYQGYARGLDIRELHALNAMAVESLWPAMTLLYDVEPLTGLSRARRRNALEGKSVSEGRFEAESLAFHTRVREGFLDLAAKNADRFVVIDGGNDQDAVFRATLRAVRERMRGSGHGSR